MARPALEIADIFRLHGPAYRDLHANCMNSEQRQVMHAVEVCRTAALGGHIDQCDHCGHRRISYNSCGNRHCPKCQSLAKAEWLENHRAQLLPVEYFHVVFTLPDSIAPIARQNKKVVYNILFRAVSETLRRIAADPKHLGAAIGFLAVLHTWGQNLLMHPHIHCVVPGGGFSPNRQRWIPCRKSFFLPIRVLSRLFRGLFLHYLQKAYAAGKLQFHGTIRELIDPQKFMAFVKDCRKPEWVVYSKPPFGGPGQVLDYLGRYTHRVAISNHRLVSLNSGKVAFRWRDYKDGNKLKTMTLDAQEFIRRFLLHVLPRGFVRIRHYGFLANPHREQNLSLCRQLLGTRGNFAPEPLPPENPMQHYERFTRESASLCPACRQGHMVLIELIDASLENRKQFNGVDSS
jgi:hypothetical protein